jgi:large subunit ribosomal protein L23
MNTIIIRPLVTEVSMKDANLGKFTFEVALFADKTQIKREVEKLFNVNVITVATSTLTRSKTRNTKFGRRVSKNKIKKARVELKKGQTIAAFETQEEGKKKRKEKKDVKKT